MRVFDFFACRVCFLAGEGSSRAAMREMRLSALAFPDGDEVVCKESGKKRRGVRFRRVPDGLGRGMCDITGRGAAASWAEVVMPAIPCGMVDGGWFFMDEIIVQETAN